MGASQRLAELGAFGEHSGRITAEDLHPHARDGQEFYGCGSVGFAESAGHLLLELGVTASDLRVERFGPTR